MSFEDDSLHGVRASINVTPLIDVLLVLLIIFMVVTPILSKAMNAKVPQEADKTILEEYSQKQLLLTLTADGRYVLNREQLTLAQLPMRVREAITLRAGQKLIFVNADDSLPYGYVVQLMDLCRSAGAEQVGLVLEPLRPWNSTE